MGELIRLYLIFMKMGAVCFGGGYALLPIIQRDIVNKYGYATNEEVADYFAIGQCTPGAIAVNVSTFIGFKRKGIAGAAAATLGFITPSIIIIGIIASFLQIFSDLPVVCHAFAGIRICVCALILNAVLGFRKSSVVDPFTFLLFAAVFLLAVLTDLSPVILVVLSGISGAVYKAVVFGGGKV